MGLGGCTTRYCMTKRLWTHVGAEVHEHIGKPVWDRPYDVSEKHVEMNLHVICAAVSLSMTVIGPRQVGHNRAELGEVISVSGTAGAIPSSWRQSSNEADR